MDQVCVPSCLSDATVTAITLALLDDLDWTGDPDPEDVHTGHE